jgi:hypothetical protein
VPEPVEPVARDAPLLRGRVVSTQSWRELTFLHWAVDPAEVEPLLPPGTRPDVFEDRTYVGLVPFRMVGVGLARGPAVPWFGTFLETNVRLYSVDRTGRRGVVFLSLDAERAVVVAMVRALVGAPYRWARMSLSRAGDTVTYRARRLLGEGRPASRVVVRVGEAYDAAPLDDFLTARWGAHVRRRRGTTFVANHHPPWQLRHAELVELDDELLAAAGFPALAGRAPDRVAFSEGVYAEFTRPRRVGT